MLLAVRPKRSTPSSASPRSSSGVSPSTKRVCCRSSLRTWKSMPAAYCGLGGGCPELALCRQQGSVGGVVEAGCITARRGAAVGGGHGSVAELCPGQRLCQPLRGDLPAVERGLGHQHRE